MTLVTQPYRSAARGVLCTMDSPRVIELPRRLEPISKDNFADRPTAEQVIVLRPRDERDEPEPPRAA